MLTCHGPGEMREDCEIRVERFLRETGISTPCLESLRLRFCDWLDEQMPLVARSLRVRGSQSHHALATFASQVNHFPYVKKSGAYVALPSAEALA